MDFAPLGELIEKSQKYELAVAREDENLTLLAEFGASGDRETLEKLVRRNQGLVRKVAFSYLGFLGNDLDVDDLIAAGNEGLLKAIERFKTEKKTALSTYALYWIRQSVLREIETFGFRIRLPVHLMEKVVRLEAFERELQWAGARRTVGVLSKLTGLKEDTIARLVEIRYKMMPNNTSLDYPIDEDGDRDGTPLINHLDGGAEYRKMVSPEAACLASDAEDRLLMMLGRVKEKEREVLIRRYGLLGKKAETLEEVGKHFGLTRERIRQIESRALEKLSAVAERYVDMEEFG